MLKKYGKVLIFCLIVCVWLIVYRDYICEKSMEALFPVIAYSDDEEKFVVSVVNNLLEGYFPLLAYEKPNTVIARREDCFYLEKMKPVELVTMMGLENGVEEKADNVTEEPPAGETEKPPASLEETTDVPTNIQETEEAVETLFVPHTLQNRIDMQVLSDYETLIKNFYTIDACAMVGSNLLNAEELMDVDLRITKNTVEPQILIYHTHSQEGFADSVAGDDATTIVGVGEHLAEILREEYGYQVLHHLGKYDEETRNNAYSRALPDVVDILEKYPSIEVVIDLHRDAVNEGTKLVMDLDGRPTARFMFFNGVSCTRNTGSISYLENPYQVENLAFSFQMKKAAEEYYPGLTRKNYIHGYRYNMHLLPRTTLIELGAQNNTLEEAMNACDPIAHILDMVLSGA